MEDGELNHLNVKEFYRELGALLYAIAYSDGKVRKKEFQALREFLLREVAPAEHEYDSSGMNKAFYTEFSFEAENEMHEAASEAFDRFVSYFRKNHKLIERPQKELILRAVDKVATAYKRTNKKEREMVRRLKLELDPASV
jgi:hypothetical protein